MKYPHRRWAALTDIKLELEGRDAAAPLGSAGGDDAASGGGGRRSVGTGAAARTESQLGGGISQRCQCRVKFDFCTRFKSC